MSDFTIPVHGMRDAVKSFDAAASRIARADFSALAGDGTGGVDIVDLSHEIVALLQLRNGFAANVNVARADDQLQQSLVNLLA